MLKNYMACIEGFVIQERDCDLQSPPRVEMFDTTNYSHITANFMKTLSLYSFKDMISSYFHVCSFHENTQYQKFSLGRGVY